MFDKIKKAIKAAWGWLMAWTQLVDWPSGKFSSKRAVFILTAILGARELILQHEWRASGCGLVIVLLGILIMIEDIQYAKKKGP